MDISQSGNHIKEEAGALLDPGQNEPPGLGKSCPILQGKPQPFKRMLQLSSLLEQCFMPSGKPLQHRDACFLQLLSNLYLKTIYTYQGGSFVC